MRWFVGPREAFGLPAFLQSCLRINLSWKSKDYNHSSLIDHAIEKIRPTDVMKSLIRSHYEIFIKTVEPVKPGTKHQRIQ